jgi:hypothetical protein
MSVYDRLSVAKVALDEVPHKVYSYFVVVKKVIASDFRDSLSISGGKRRCLKSGYCAYY